MTRFRPSLAQYRAAKEIAEHHKEMNETRGYIIEELMARRSANLLEISDLKRTELIGLVLSILSILSSAYQAYEKLFM